MMSTLKKEAALAALNYLDDVRVLGVGNRINGKLFH